MCCCINRRVNAMSFYAFFCIYVVLHVLCACWRRRRVSLFFPARVAAVAATWWPLPLTPPSPSPSPRSPQPQSSIPNPHPLSYLLTLVHALTHQMYYRWSSKVALEYILGPQQSFRRQCEKYEKEVRNGGQGSKYWQNQVGRIVHSAFVIATRNATISSDLCATGSFHHTVVELGMSSVS